MSTAAMCRVLGSDIRPADKRLVALLVADQAGGSDDFDVLVDSGLIRVVAEHAAMPEETVTGLVRELIAESVLVATDEFIDEQRVYRFMAGRAA